MKKIGIAGCGGIGSNTAVNLVRSGVDNLLLVDFDIVERSNLNRQFYFNDQIGMSKAESLLSNLKRILPECKGNFEVARLNSDNIKDVFRDCDIIVEAFDRPEMKKMLYEAFIDSDKIIVGANGISGSSLDGIIERNIGNLTVIGDFKSDCRYERVYSHKVQAIVARITDAVLKRGGYYE